VIQAEKDIFGKIDAILEKRDVEALMEKPVFNDDFPMLTEVIEAEPLVSKDGVGRGVRCQVTDQRRNAERRLGERRISLQDPESGDLAISHGVEMTFSVLEKRLADLLTREQLRSEERLTKLIIDLLNVRSELKR
jgi:hypothetical protein